MGTMKFFLEVGDGDPDEDGGHPQGVPDGKGNLIQGVGRDAQRDGRGQVGEDVL